MKEAKIAWINFRQWVTSPQKLSALLCLILYTYDQLHGMTSFARNFDCKVTRNTISQLKSSIIQSLPVILEMT